MKQHEVKIVGTAGPATKQECLAEAKALSEKLEATQKGKFAMNWVKAMKSAGKFKAATART